MIPLWIQIVLPFLLSASVVVGISIIAEKFGTKIGGIIGTLPSTIIVAYVFISLNQGEDFAARSASVVPAEMGVNILFLFIFSVLADRRVTTTVVASLGLWSVLSLALYLTSMNNIFISTAIFFAAFIVSLIILEKKVKVKSVGKVEVEYTLKKIMFRGVLAGIVISISVLLSNVGSVLSGIFSVFPAIFLSTMLIFTREHGPRFVGGTAKSMIFGTPSVVSYSVGIALLFPVLGMIWGSVASFMIALTVTLTLLKFRIKLA